MMDILAANPIELEYCLIESDPTGVRTQDPNIKSVVLYQLSY